MKIKITKLILTILLANFLLVNFVFAQAAPADPPATTGTAITKEDEANAQKGVAECTAFRIKVFNNYKNQLKAVWYEEYDLDSGINQGCYIVGGNFADKDKVDVSDQGINFSQGLEYGQIQTGIKEGKAVDPRLIAEAQIRELDEQQKANPLSMLVGWFINSVFTVATAVVSILTAIAGGIFSYTVEMILKVTDMPPIVNLGWSIMRDFANMFFILILIVIALAAILRIESYDYRHLLTEVVIMALLVNFSKIIAVTLLNFTNTIVAMFAIDGLREVGGFIYSFVRPGELITFLPGGGWMSALVQGISKLIFSFVALTAFLALAGLFVVRLVGIYVLVIISPMAYVLDILPATKHYAHEWWQAFVKYLVWAPVAMFFVRLTIWLAENGLKIKGFETGKSSAFDFVILIGFMWASVIVAEHAGMVGGNAVIHTAEKVGHGLAHMAGHYAGRRWNQWTTQKFLESHDGKERGVVSRGLFAVFNPVAAVKGAKQRSEELSHMAQEEAAAGGREVMEQMFTTRFIPGKGFGKAKLKIPYRQFIARKDEDKFLKDYGNMKKESLMRAAVDAEGMKGFEGEARKRAIIKAAASNGYLDDVMRMKPFAEKYTGSDNVVYGAESLNRFLYGYLGHGEQASRFMAEDMEELGKKVKHYEYLGHAYYDPDKKEWKRGMETEKNASGNTVFEKVKRGGKTVDVEKFKPLDAKSTWQVKYAVGEFAKLGGRDRVGAAPHNFTAIRAEVNEDGTFKDEGQELDKHLTFGREDGHFDTFNEEMLKRMDSDVMREVQHAQARVKTWLLSDQLVPGKDGRGTIVLEDEEHAKELRKLYEINPEFVKGLYTKVLKVKGDAREQIDGIRFVTRDQVEIVDEKVVGFKPGTRVAEVGRPTFTYTDNPPKVEGKKSGDGEPKIILTDAR